jgi:glyoxylase-like metal-dependent hydrolase (beta-lactamase superfamily II)
MTFSIVLQLFLVAAPPPVQLKQVSPRLYQVLDGSGARGGACLTSEGVILIDSKMDGESVAQTAAELRKVTDKPILYVINTHSDADHVRGNRFFPSYVRFIAHENCRREMLLPGRDGKPSEWNSPEFARFLPTITFRDRLALHVGGVTLELLYFGVGHTTGDIVIYLPEDKAAFVGDQIFVSRPQLIHAYKGGNSFDHVRTLTRMLDTLDAEKFFSGHEEMLDRVAILSHIDTMRRMQEKVSRLVNEGRSLDEIKKGFQPNEANLIEIVYQEVQKLRLM